MNRFYTSVEQSKHLLSLGINPETADMLWEQHTFDSPYVTIKPYTTKGKSIGAHILPCWSLGALINLMPSTIYKDGETITLTIYKDVVYHYFVCYTSHYHLDEIWFSKENLLDSVFEMVCWLLKNGYIKKGE